MEELVSTRTHRLKGTIDHWRGLLGTWAVVGAEALREIGSRATPDPRWTDAGLAEFSATVYYDTSNEKFTSLSAFKVATAKIDPASVRGLEMDVSTSVAATKPYGLKFYAWDHSGVSITAKAEDETWVRGVLDVYRDKLAVGEVPRYSDHRRAYRASEVAWLSLFGLLLAGCIGLSVFVDLAFLGAVVLAALGLWSMVWVSRPLGDFDRRVENPRLAFIGPRDRLPGRPRDGPIWRFVRWLDEHPVVRKMLEWTMAGSVGAAIAKLF